MRISPELMRSANPYVPVSVMNPCKPFFTQHAVFLSAEHRKGDIYGQTGTYIHTHARSMHLSPPCPCPPTHTQIGTRRLMTVMNRCLGKQFE